MTGRERLYRSWTTVLLFLMVLSLLGALFVPGLWWKFLLAAVVFLLSAAFAAVLADSAEL